MYKDSLFSPHPLQHLLYIVFFIAAILTLVAQAVKNLPAVQETWVQSLGQEDPLGGGNGNPLQHSCLGNPMDRGAWRATAHGVSRHNLATKPPPITQFLFFYIIFCHLLWFLSSPQSPPFMNIMFVEFLYFLLYFFFFHFERIDKNGPHFVLWFCSNLSSLFFPHCFH